MSKTKDKTVTWSESSSAYWFDCGYRTACCGDGVDMFFTEDGEAISPGTPEFEACMDAACLDPETWEAYFGS